MFFIPDKPLFISDLLHKARRHAACLSEGPYDNKERQAMRPAIKKTLTVFLALVALAALCGPATAQNQASSDLLLPYFEVDSANAGGLTTLFAVGNSTDQPVEVMATVFTNWGIPILEVPFTLQAREIRTVNLRDWFRQGGDPKKVLGSDEVKHLAAAASGQRSPKDNLYYGSEVRPDLQVGYVTLRTRGNRPDALWGDWFNVDVAGNLARGDVLVNIDRSTGCPGLCQRHLVRYLSGGGFDGGTEVIIWRETLGKPSANPEAGDRMQADATAFNEPGQPIENRQLALLPVEKVLVSELGLQEPFGALDVETEEETFFAVQHTAENRYSVGLTTYCLPRVPKPGPDISILKLTNGEDADKAPGPSIPVGGTVTWEYLVTNTGNVELTDIVVEDDREGIVSCPHDSLVPGESMTCTATGTAKACQYENLGTATAQSSEGEVSAADGSHYFGDDGAELALAIQVNGQKAGTPKGPGFDVGDNLDWTFTVTNSGKVRLTGVQLSGIAAACPKSALDPGESMDCTAAGGKAVNGEQSLPVSVTGDTACSEAAASGIGYYVGNPGGGCDDIHPAITIETATNGQDADQPQGPHIQKGSAVLWTYVVTNTGDVPLTGVAVTDDKGVTVSCPKAALAAGESMTCTASGTAQIGQYANVGAVTGQPSCGNPVSDDDPSHYYGTDPDDPGLTIVKLTNGQDANTAPGPEIAAGSTVTWTYIVTNTGNVTLSNLKVTDDKGVAVSCPKTTLAAGESMTCTGSGKAQACQYENLGTVTGKTPGGESLSASDPSHYYGKTNPAIQIDNKVNGDDADSPKGPEVAVGSALSFTYVVKNTGDSTLTGIKVTDSKGVAVSCPKTNLAAGESMTCTGSGTAQSGQYSATATATGNGPCDQKVSDDDPVHYWGFILQGDEGCTPGYWKNHTDSWPPTGYTTSQKVQSVFSQASLYPGLGSSTLLQALSFQGGTDLAGAAGNLLRAATAALLNSAHSGVDYPWVTASVISDVNAALASKNRDTIIDLASDLDQDNNLGCPLN